MKTFREILSLLVKLAIHAKREAFLSMVSLLKRSILGIILVLVLTNHSVLEITGHNVRLSGDVSVDDAMHILNQTAPVQIHFQ